MYQGHARSSKVKNHGKVVNEHITFNLQRKAFLKPNVTGNFDNSIFWESIMQSMSFWKSSLFKIKLKNTELLTMVRNKL